MLTSTKSLENHKADYKRCILFGEGYLMAIGQGFHAKPSPTLGWRPAGVKHDWQGKRKLGKIGADKDATSNPDPAWNFVLQLEGPMQNLLGALVSDIQIWADWTVTLWRSLQLQTTSFAQKSSFASNQVT